MRVGACSKVGSRFNLAFVRLGKKADIYLFNDKLF